MIVTSRFVFLHLHKSGGTFVNEFLMRYVPDARQVGYHLPWSHVPPGADHLPVLGFVRNPWSYYVSWYRFQSTRPQPNALFRTLSDDGRLGFEGTIARMTNLGVTADTAGAVAGATGAGTKLDALIAALPPTYMNRGLNLPGPALARIRGSELGFYSFLYRYLFEGARVPHVGRMESLRQELPGMLTAAGQPVDDSMRSHIRDAPALNATDHTHYASYYSPALRDQVGERDAAIITQYGYRFGE